PVLSVLRPDLLDPEHSVLNRKAHLQACESESVDPLWIPLIGWSGILSQHTLQSSPVRLRNPVEQLLRDLHLQAPVRVRRRKALSRLWPAVRIGHIGFDIID